MFIEVWYEGVGETITSHKGSGWSSGWKLYAPPRTFLLWWESAISHIGRLFDVIKNVVGLPAWVKKWLQ